ncbi:hypothetical protein FACS189437_10680 [Bacteroidia bacterium]|nr:hypothetical protein FACS189437_10680 [Bacteroidia bacterium]
MHRYGLAVRQTPVGTRFVKGMLVYNTAVGGSALAANTTASGNTAVGYRALPVNTTGSRNVAVGDSAIAASATASNQLKIGTWITGNEGRIRIGNANPHATAVLDLNADNTATPGGVGRIFVRMK